eukprot:SAG31_NODE_2193_length_6224_cov_3.425469_2_plen_58_part_00
MWRPFLSLNAMLLATTAFIVTCRHKSINWINRLGDVFIPRDPYSGDSKGFAFVRVRT